MNVNMSSNTNRTNLRRFYDRLSRFYGFVGVFDNHCKKKALSYVDLHEGARFLDAGSGDGYALFAAGARSSDCEFFGVDFSLNMTKLASKRGILRCHVSAGDCFNLPYKSSSFDVVFSSFVLDLFDRDDRERVARELCRVLRKSGTLVLVNNTRGRGFFWWLSSLYLMMRWVFPKAFLDMPISASEIINEIECLEVKENVVFGFTEIVVSRKMNNKS